MFNKITYINYIKLFLYSKKYGGDSLRRGMRLILEILKGGVI